jgi:hypothetical protein
MRIEHAYSVDAYVCVYLKSRVDAPRRPSRRHARRRVHTPMSHGRLRLAPLALLHVDSVCTPSQLPDAGSRSQRGR